MNCDNCKKEITNNKYNINKGLCDICITQIN